MKTRRAAMRPSLLVHSDEARDSELATSLGRFAAGVDERADAQRHREPSSLPSAAEENPALAISRPPPLPSHSRNLQILLTRVKLNQRLRIILAGLL